MSKKDTLTSMYDKFWPNDKKAQEIHNEILTVLMKHDITVNEARVILKRCIEDLLRTSFTSDLRLHKSNANRYQERNYACLPLQENQGRVNWCSQLWTPKSHVMLPGR